jgi:ABC-type oligopeptide transport system substrate-binding subunit
MRRISAAVVLMAMISLLTGATGAGAQDSSGEDDKLVFRVGSTNDIDGFNPFKIVEIPSYEVMGLTYDLLVDSSPKDSSPVPGRLLGDFRRRPDLDLPPQQRRQVARR